MFRRMLVKPRKWLFLLLALVLLWVGSFHNQPIRAKRKELGYEANPVHGTSPTLFLLTTALGAFRGIILDVIWIRMQDLKQDGKFFEIVQLADLACKLDPRMAQAWAFNAWNMAYNVSVEIPELYERWRWVRAGIDLLKNEGIPYNPHSPLLYKELAWIYLHKVGGVLDDAHLYYKLELGEYMHEILGGPGTKEELESFLKAPKSDEELRRDKDVDKFVKTLRDAGFNPLDIEQFFGYLRNPKGTSEKVRKLLTAAANKKVMARVTTFMRAKRLRDECRLEAAKMIQLMDKYGPLDWRSPFANAIYWADRGLQEARAFNKKKEELLGHPYKSDDDKPYREIDFERIFYGAFQDLVRQGRLLFDPQGRLVPWMLPDYRFADALTKITERLLDKYKGETLGLDAFYENFLNRMVVEFYMTGNKTKSFEYWKRLIARYGFKSRYKKKFEPFVRDEFQQYVKDMSAVQATQIVYGALIMHFLYLGCNQDELAGEQLQFAKAISDYNNKDADGYERIMIPFDQVRKRVLMDVFAGNMGFPMSVLQRLRERLGPEAETIIKELQALARKQQETLKAVQPKQKMKK